jgi:iron(III) transport system permease protein
MGEPVAAAKLAMILLAFVGFLLVVEQLARRRARFHDASSPRRRIRVRLSPARGHLATLACILPLGVGFVIPALILARLGLSGSESLSASRFVTLAANSFAVSAVTAALAVTLALAMAYGARISRSRVAAAVNRIAGLGYAVPGAVIAIGVLIPAARLDNVMADWLSASFGIAAGLMLTGSIVALVYAYLIRFLAIALQSVEAGLATITPNMEDAARSLGLGAARTLARVHVPMMRSSLATGALLVFVDVMKELPATFVMRPFNFDTLAVQAYNFAADERLAEAATVSLAIVAVGLLPLVIASRRMVRPETGGEAPGSGSRTAAALRAH